MSAEKRNQGRIFLSLLLLCGVLFLAPVTGSAQEKVGVMFVVHGGFSTYSDQAEWDSAVQMFSYEPNHPVYKFTIWGGPDWWPGVLLGNPKETRKYPWEYQRIGGTDPFSSITQKQLADMTAELQKYSCNVTFEVELAQWLSGDDISRFPYPRFIYNGPPGKPYKCSYCGENEPGRNGQPWPGCDSNRYNVDGPVERLLNKGVSRIIIIDLTVAGVRFQKTYNVLTMTKKVLSDKGINIPVFWINDPNSLMLNSYPTSPTNWTPQWSYNQNPKRGPYTDPSVPLAGNPNPISEDQELAALNVEGIEAGFSPTVTDANTGVILLNHPVYDWGEYFDPKIDDTLILNQNIKTALLARHSGIDQNNIVGAWMGLTEDGTAEGCANVELTRHMRGENLGQNWLYEQTQLVNGVWTKQSPIGQWGYRYWDALAYLKSRGVTHIVIGFPQIISDSVLNLVEIPNQIGKEIGTHTWAGWGTTLANSNYPGIGSPFADHWGVWVDTTCGTDTNGNPIPCCFKAAGCGSGYSSYPPPRQVCPRDVTYGTTDPSLAFDESDYGLLDYHGTWDMYRPASGNPRVGKMLAQHILSVSGFTCTSSTTTIAVSTTTTIAPTVITLAEFNALPGSGRVTLTWTTASEIDTAGFNIYRSTEENGQYVKINSALIKATGSPGAGATYQFADNAAQNRKTYWYKLEDIDVSGKATMHGPVSATPKLINIFNK